MKTDLTRRQFLKMTGTGLAIAVAATGSGFRLVSAAELEKAGPGFRPSVWLEVRPDDLVIVTVSKSEMGQGIYTSLPMIVADELDADWKNVRMEPAPAGDAYKDPVWRSQATGGSSSIRHMYEPLRKAGAAAREMLLTAAAREWNVPLKECAVATGMVKHIKSESIAHLRRAHAGGREARGAAEPRAQEREPVPVYRQGHPEARHPGQSERHCALRHRHLCTGHGLCRDSEAARLWGRSRRR